MFTFGTTQSGMLFTRANIWTVGRQFKSKLKTENVLIFVAFA